MSVGPLGNTAGLSGAQNDVSSQVRRGQAEQKAHRAEGLGATDADAETSDRDADGRRIWELPHSDADEESEATADDEHEPSADPPRSKDPSGASGGLIDLTG